MLAITIGLAATIYLGGLHVDLLTLLGRKAAPPPVKVSFTWFALIGAVIVCGIGVLFRTPQRVLDEAARKAEEARGGEDRPMALRAPDSRGTGASPVQK